MRIGIACDLKTAGFSDSGGRVLPDDWQEEYDDPATVGAIADAFRRPGHEVEVLGDGPDLLRRLLDDPPDFVFNMAEGQGISRSREARVPAVLEMLGIPYSGSDPLTLALTLDKQLAKQTVASCPSLAVPAGILIHAGDDPERALRCAGMTFPVLAKPAWEGSSKGIRGPSLVRRPEDLARVVDGLHEDHRQPVLVEEFIDGDELTVGVIGNGKPQVLGVMRIVPLGLGGDEPFLYSLEVKRDWRRRVRYEAPPPYGPRVLARIESAALEAYAALGCRDVARIDFRLHPCRGPVFLEANPLPGLNPESSDLVLLAARVGWTHQRLLEAILSAALQRQEVAGGVPVNG